MADTRPAPPAAFEELKKAYPDVGEAYEKLAGALHNSGPLTPQSRELVKLGMSIGAGLESATKAHVRFALSAGLSAEEIRHAALLAVTTIGWPSMMRAMTWIEDVLKKK